jgi:hypothetical protein
MNRLFLSGSCLCAVLQGALSSALAWDYEAHRLVNQLALSSLPTNFPALVRVPVAQERIAFLSGEPDRWRNVQDLPLRHYNGPDHYIDVEELAVYGLKPELLPVFRYDFVAQLALIRREHPEKFASIDAGRNEDHTRELVGLLPWTIAEHYSKLKSAFACLKTFQEEGGTPEEIANAEANVIYVMGVMGHYVGDAAQPLHTTIHHHGWAGENPHQYSTNSRIHSWIDGGYLARVGAPKFDEMRARLRAAQGVRLSGRAAKPEEIFQVSTLFILEQNQMVEPLFQMEKDGKFSGNGEAGREGKAFLETQLVKAGQLLGDVWFSAWEQAPPDTFLKNQLARRKKGPPARPELN